MDLRRAPCIYDAGGESEWVIVVDMFGRSRFDEVASECPSFGSGTATHAVVVAPDGELIAAR